MVTAAGDRPGRAVRGRSTRHSARRSRTSPADLRVPAGEYLAEEGDEGALFAVLEGRVEPVKRVDGVERIVGRRDPGDCFGEVPLTLGTVFPVGSAPGSAVARHAARPRTSTTPRPPPRRRWSSDVAKLAAHRIGGARGLQGLAAEQPAPRAIVVGHRRDVACVELRRFLDRNQVTFVWIMPDAPDARGAVGRLAPRPTTTCPTIRVIERQDCHPAALRRVAELLGLGTEPDDGRLRRRHRRRGPGRSGGRACTARRKACARSWSSARPRAARRGRRRGSRTTSVSPRGVSGRRAREPRAAAGASARRRDPRHPHDHRHRRRRRGTCTSTAATSLRARTIILACGVTWRRLPFDGLRAAGRQGHRLRRGRPRAPSSARARRAHPRCRQLSGAGGALLLEPRPAAHDRAVAATRSRRACPAT